MTELTTYSYNKIGFHLLPGAPVAEVQTYLQRLDTAGVSFTLKVVDDYQFCQLATPYQQAAHTITFRLTGREPETGYDYATADMQIDPEEAARTHWRKLLRQLPANFDRERVWLEPLSEPPADRGDWLGQFASTMGELAVQEGYKLWQFSFAAGAPVADQWETPGMLRYLRLCAAHPAQLGVGLHEYSWDVRDIWRLRPELLGRFVQLFDVCDRYGIARPKLLLTEWGWTRHTVPTLAQVLRDLEAVLPLYGAYPEIVGGAMWSLGGVLAGQTHRLLAPVTKYTLGSGRAVAQMGVLSTAVLPPPPVNFPAATVTPTPMPGVLSARSLATSPTQRSNGRYLADVTIPDDVDIITQSQFAKKWRVQNNGQTTWGEGFSLRFIGGTRMSEATSYPVPALAPGQAGVLTVPMIAPTAVGMTYSDWRLHNAQGQPFGDLIYVRYNVTPPLPVTGINDAAFVADVTIPDDTLLQPGQSFSKTWRLRNAGTLPWVDGYRLTFVGGAMMHQQVAVAVPRTLPGQMVEVSVPLTAPTLPGGHYADWRMQDATGEFFGEIVYLRITVPEGAHGRVQPLSQNDPRWKSTRLGESKSDTTIGQWGCLLTTFAMIANNYYDQQLTPLDLNNRMLHHRLFLNHKETPWAVLATLFNDLIFEGHFHARQTPDLTDRIDRALRQGQPVAVQVDQTPATPYTLADQHWVLVTARDGADYRINDPLLYPASESSLRQRYGRPGESLRGSIVSAVFYRSTKPQPPLPVQIGGVLGEEPEKPPVKRLIERGMNINPDAPHSNPTDVTQFKGLEWVRLVCKVAAQPDPAQRNLAAALARYDPIVKAYQQVGVKTLFVLNQETVWANGPWDHGDWPFYATQLAETAGQIAQHFARYGGNVAYQIWNEGDLAHNPSSIYVKPEDYAVVLEKTCAAIRAASPSAPLVLGGLASGPNRAIPYLQTVLQHLPQQKWPMDAAGVHPYGRWGRKAPFDWGQTFGTLSQALAEYEKAFPDLKLWITEIGVAADNEIGPVYYQEIGAYLADVFGTLNERHATQVPVVIWFAWSDWMRNAGIIRQDGQPKPFVYEAFLQVRDNKHLV